MGPDEIANYPALTEVGICAAETGAGASHSYILGKQNLS